MSRWRRSKAITAGSKVTSPKACWITARDALPAASRVNSAMKRVELAAAFGGLRGNGQDWQDQDGENSGNGSGKHGGLEMCCRLIAWELWL